MSRVSSTHASFRYSSYIMQHFAINVKRTSIYVVASARKQVSTHNM
jgi:hypothetical protein